VPTSPSWNTQDTIAGHSNNTGERTAIGVSVAGVIVTLGAIFFLWRWRMKKKKLQAGESLPRESELPTQANIQEIQERPWATGKGMSQLEIKEQPEY